MAPFAFALILPEILYRNLYWSHMDSYGDTVILSRSSCWLRRCVVPRPPADYLTHALLDGDVLHHGGSAAVRIEEELLPLPV